MQTLPLFDDIPPECPKTQGIKYAGSKLKLLPYILQLASEIDAHTVLDGFSGTTRVSQAFARVGYQVISNDISAWSEVFAQCYLLSQGKKESYKGLIDHLNSLPPTDGWFTEHYGGLSNGGSAVQADTLKKPWQIHNTRKLDAIRGEIDRLPLSSTERAVALTSLILALDRVDNTIGHFVSYLKEWSPRSYNDLTLRVPELFPTANDHKVVRSDILELLPSVSADLAYFDPPYGSNNEKMPPSRVRYAAYYHLWTTLCLHDNPQLFGKAKRRSDSSDRVATSIFEEFRTNENGRFIVVEAIERLINEANVRFIILSYSSGGRATADELKEVLSNCGTILKIVELDHKKNVMAGMKWTNDWIRDIDEPNRELLFLIEKG